MNPFIETAIDTGGSVAALQAALENGASIERDGDEALIWASRFGYADIAEFLITHGMDADYNNGQPLQMAAEEGHAELAEMLLKHGADVRRQGDIALQRAAKQGHADVVRVLVDHGADVSVADYHPFCVASKYGHLDVVKILIEKSPVNGSSGLPLRHAVEHGHTDIARFLIESGADVKHLNMSSLYDIFAHGNAPMFQLLLEKGVQVDQSQLGIATANDQYEMMAIILDEFTQRVFKGKQSKLILQAADIEMAENILAGKAQEVLAMMPAEKYEALMDSEHKESTTLLRAMAVMGRLPKLFEPQHWREAPEAANELYKDIKRALPQYCHKVDGIDMTAFQTGRPVPSFVSAIRMPGTLKGSAR